MSAARALPPARRRAVAWSAAGSLLAAVCLAACDPHPPQTTPPSAPAADAPRDVLADLDRAVWSVTDAASMLALDVDESAVDTAAWTRDGIDPAAIEATRRSLADFLAVSTLSPEALRGTADAADQQAIIDAAPAIWKGTLEEQWSAGQRRFYAIEFAEPYRVIGTPRAALTWRLADLDDGHRVTLGGTVAYSVIDTRTGRTGAFAVRIGVVATPGAPGEDTPTAATSRVTLNGQDLCAIDAGDGTIVPAIGTGEDARAAQQAVMDTVIARPGVSAEAIADETSEALQGDAATAVTCD